MYYGRGGPDAEDWSPEEIAQIMFPASVHRGPHAFGWMSYNKHEDAITVAKFPGRSDTPEAMQRMALDPKARWWVGHVRYATHGSPQQMWNNHPIVHKDIIGVHNGVLSNHNLILRETGREDERSEVDSEAIFAAVHKWGHVEGIGKIRGDMVAVYVNRKYPNTVNFARTMGRELYLARSKAGSLVFASEAEIIESLDLPLRWMSKISKYRLLRVRGGKIKEKLDLIVPPPVHYPPVRPMAVQQPKEGEFKNRRKKGKNKKYQEHMSRSWQQLEKEWAEILERQRTKSRGDINLGGDSTDG